jgi:hypothetical protein
MQVRGDADRSLGAIRAAWAQVRAGSAMAVHLMPSIVSFAAPLPRRSSIVKLRAITRRSP